MNRKSLFLTGILLALFCFGILLVFGTSATVVFHVRSAAQSPDDFTISTDSEKEIVRITDKKLENGSLYVTVRGVSRGRCFIDVVSPEGQSSLELVYVHAFRIVTVNSFFGTARGSRLIPFVIFSYLLLILWSVIRVFRKDVKRTIYQYRNIRNLGWILFLGLMLLGQIPNLLSDQSLAQSVSTQLKSASSAAILILPLAFITAIMVTISNIRLMKKEGRNWRNMLGLMLSILVLVGTVFPPIFSEYLQHSNTVIDVHNQRGWGLYAEMTVYNTILVCVSYLECILIAAIILSVKAAKAVPGFDKDYILILGCQIRKDGSLTPLLKGRVDRALEFARLQKEAAGKDIVFVPSGGQGPDEVTSEAEAMHRYLNEVGIPDDRILVEDRSLNTQENLRNSISLIRERSGSDGSKIAFSTTNYHVFRSGILAENEGIHAEGIGSKTRSYFWINAFIREFIATLYSERRKHLRVIAALIFVILLLIFIVYLSNTL